MENKKKILLVEDDAFILELYTTKFELEGFEVFRAKDGQEGVEVFSEKRPDVVLLDIKLPRIDGWTALKEMKKVKKETPVVMFTNLNEKEELEKLDDNSADGYLIKSFFTPEEVVSKVKEILTNKK